MKLWTYNNILFHIALPHCEIDSHCITLLCGSHLCYPVVQFTVSYFVFLIRIILSYCEIHIYIILKIHINLFCCEIHITLAYHKLCITLWNYTLPITFCKKLYDSHLMRYPIAISTFHHPIAPSISIPVSKKGMLGKIVQLKKYLNWICGHGSGLESPCQKVVK